MGMNRAAFFDRDGTINEDVGYLSDPADLRFIKGVPELIRKHNEAGDLVIVVTNQSGIARGMYTEADMHELHHVLNERLEGEYGAHVDAFYFCPHHPDYSGACDCRKPEPGLFLRAMSDFGIDPALSVSYGDSERDMVASKAAGICEWVRICDRHAI
jgi:D-glycero-D-manno-heptose 1,7-bisphosphate phosphatase